MRKKNEIKNFITENGNNKQQKRIQFEKQKRTMTSKVMKFNCECCGYATQNKSNFQRHLKTRKHQRNIGLCVENIHLQECYKAEKGDEYWEDPENTIVVEWDYDNKLVDELMDEEYKVMELDTKKNCMWIEQVKKQANWERGQRINIGLKQNCDGCFFVFIGNDDDEGDDWKCSNYQYISEEGLFMTKTMESFRKFYDKIITREEWINEREIYYEVNCMYNDNVRYELELEENGGYVMK